jgi:hypothetical protein
VDHRGNATSREAVPPVIVADSAYNFLTTEDRKINLSLLQQYDVALSR